MVRWPRLSRKLRASNNEASSVSVSTTPQSQPLASSRKTFPSGIKLLHDGEASAIDIIFVHGLTGDREKTWKTESAESPWPETLLPSKVPNARILTFGYDAYVTDWRGMVSKNRLGNHSMSLLTAVATYREDDDTNSRPIIFVCHSLGGLVCEDALSAAQQRPERYLKKVLHCTRGIVFLGTPHHGSGLAHWAESLAQAIGVLKQTNAEILTVLRSDSEVLERVQNSFHTMIRSRGQDGLPPIEITCFFEELPLPGVGIVVPSHSAILPGYIPIGIRSNHMDMTKFEDEKDPRFIAVAGELRRWCRELCSSSTSGTHTLTIAQQEQPAGQGGPWFVIPYPSNADFVGRSSILKRLEKILSPSDCLENRTHHVRVALHGLGGIGKTQIAINYAYWAHEAFPEMSIFWIHASSPARFHQSILKIAEECQIPGHDDPMADKGNLVKEWLQGKNCPSWLIVFDNADDYTMFFGPHGDKPNSPNGTVSGADGRLGGYIPECPHGSILITTRNKQAAVKLTRNRCLIAVEKMDDMEASQLVIKKLEDDTLDHSQVDLLSSRLENLPLALAQAAAFIRENSMSVEEYLQQLDRGDDHLAELLSQPFEEVGRDSEVPNAVIATWMLSFNQIRAQCSLASDMLSLMSYFDRQRIPKTFLQHGKEQEKNHSDDWQQSGASTALEQEKAIGVLKAFSFIVASTEDNSLNVHRLVQLATRKWLITERTAKAWAEKAMLVLSDIYPYGSHENRRVCNDYLPHAYAVLSCKFSLSADAAIARASLLHCISGLMFRQGQWKKAEQSLVEAAGLRKKNLGAEHPSTLTSISNLASTYRNQGQWKAAEKLDIQVMETSLRVLGAEHLDTLISISNLASTYGNQGQWKAAEEMEIQVMETSLRVLGAEHPDTLVSISNLASTYRNQGRWKEAEEMEIQVMETKLRVLGAEHPDTLVSIGNLASTYGNQGRWKEAEELNIQVMETKSRVLGVEHPSTLISIGNLAWTFRNQGRWKEAEEMNKQVMETRKRVLGAEHPDTLTSMNNLAITWKGQGRDAEALKLMEECVQLQTRVLGINHPATTFSSAALLSWQTGELDLSASGTGE